MKEAISKHSLCMGEGISRVSYHGWVYLHPLPGQPSKPDNKPGRASIAEGRAVRLGVNAHPSIRQTCGFPSCIILVHLA